MTRLCRYHALLGAALILSLCWPAAATEKKIVIAGTGDSQLLLRTLAAAFEKAHPGIRVEVPESIGSSGGIRAVADGRCELGRTARPLQEKEKDYGLNYREFAYSPVVFTANLPVACLDGLSTEQVLEIYNGTTTSWGRFPGCPDHTIYVANREPGDSSRSVLERHLDGFGKIGALAGETVYSTPETKETLIRHPYTLGYLPLAMARGTSLTILKVDGIAPSEADVQQNRYRLITPFGLVWRGELTGPAKQFRDFLFSAEGRHLISASGAVPAASPQGL